MSIPICVVCTSPQSEARWRSVHKYLGNVQVAIHGKGESASEAINSLVAESDEDKPYALFCSETSMVGKSLVALALVLATELEKHASGLWGMAGNAGLLFDGQTARGFSFPRFGFETGRHPQPVALLEDGVLLLNAWEMKRRGLRLPPISGANGISILLSLECLRLGLSCLVDARLFAVQPEVSADGVLNFLKSKAFADYYAMHFRTPRLSYRGTTVDLSSHMDFSWIDLTPEGGRRVPCERIDVWASAEALARELCRRLKTSITMVCRTTYARPAQLARAIRSIAAAQARTKSLDVRVLVLSTVEDQERMGQEVRRLKSQVPQLEVAGAYVSCPPDRASRTHLVVAGFERATTDYLWFLDDDDFLFANALASIEPYVNLGKANLLICDTAVFEEDWGDVGVPGEMRLRAHRCVDVYRGNDFARCLFGQNVIPNCGMIYPVRQILPILQAMPCAGDQYEDHFLHAAALSSPDAEAVVIPRVLAGISRPAVADISGRRGGDDWNMSLATFMGDLLNSERGASPLFWYLAGLSGQGGVDRRSRNVVQVFMPQEGKYSEAWSIIQPMEDKETLQTLRFRIAPWEQGAVRVDMGRSDGYAEIRAIRLLREVGHPEEKDVLWSCDATSAFSALQTTPSVSLAGRTPEGDLRMYLWGADPRFYLGIPADLQAEGEIVLELEFCYSHESCPSYRKRIRQDFRAALPEKNNTDRVNGTNLQLFMEHQGAWEVGHSVTLPLQPTATYRRYRFSVCLQAPKGLRLDIGNEPASVVIKELMLRSEENEGPPGIQMRWNAESNFDGLTALRNAIIGERGATEGLSVRLTGVDPQLFISLGKRVLEGRFVFEVELRYEI